MCRSSRNTITGSNTLSCSCPPSAAIVTVTSPPITSKQTWFTASGITGLTLPGMMLEPGCRSGRWISARPVVGPDDIQRRSLQVFVTPLNAHIGYEQAAKVAKQALAEGATIRETVLAMGFVERGELTEEQLDAALDVDSMTGRTSPG